MSLFEKRTAVFGPEDVRIGEFDPTADGLYRNVVTIPLDVKPKHVIYVKAKSDNPFDIVIAKENGSAVVHKEGNRDIQLGPFPTEKADSMGIILGVFRGDKATVNLEVWMERK